MEVIVVLELTIVALKTLAAAHKATIAIWRQICAIKPLKISQLLLIGEKKELSLRSRTKECADPAGLSLQLAPWKEDTRLPVTTLLSSLSNNSLTVHQLKETKDVVEDSWMMLSNMLNKPPLRLKLNTLTEACSTENVTQRVV